MLIYLLKTTACMGIFLLFYKLLLEKENMNVFKRFYLLISILAAFIIPSLVFVEYVTPVATSPTFSQVLEETPLIAPQDPIKDIAVINWSLLAWCIYSLGVVLFGIRFLRNLFKILIRIQKNIQIKEHFTIKVLLLDELPPHTFFKYIFLNKHKFKSNSIPKEVVLHEEVHAKQYHSIDVLFIEFLQVVFWFNPLFHFFKRSIKLNHEFLADSGVIQKTVSTSDYQNTLLSYLSKDSTTTHSSIRMANAINYSSIKKRFKIMKTETSKKAVALRTFVMLPIVAVLIYGFSETKTIEREITPHTQYEHSVYDPVDYIKIYIDEKQQIIINENIVPVPLLSKKIADIMVTYNNSGNPLQDVHIQYLGKLDIDFLDVMKIEIEKAGASIRLLTTDILIINDQEKWERNYKGVDYIVKDSLFIKLKNGNQVTGTSKEKSASKKQIIEYNILAKKYNAIPIKERDITSETLKILQSLYHKMSTVQKANAEPFPDFPETPPAPEAPKTPAKEKTIEQQDKNPKTGFVEANGQTLYYTAIKGTVTYYNRWGQKVDRKGEIIDPEQTHAEKVIKGQVISKIYTDDKVVAEFNTKNRSIPLPLISTKPPKVLKGKVSHIPAPPEPVEPLEHVIEMAKKGATFFYEGKEISSDKAIELLKKNKNLNIQSSGNNSKKPKVSISKHPIGSVQYKKITDPILGYTATIDSQNSDIADLKKKRKNEVHLNSRFDSFIIDAIKNDITFYFKNQPISIKQAEELLNKHQKTSAIVSHLKHPQLKRLDIITDLDKSLEEFVSKQYEAISL